MVGKMRKARRLRYEQGIGSKAAAQTAGCGQITLLHFESGRRMLRWSWLLAYARLLGVSVEEIMEEDR